MSEHHTTKDLKGKKKILSITQDTFGDRVTAHVNNLLILGARAVMACLPNRAACVQGRCSPEGSVKPQLRFPVVVEEIHRGSHNAEKRRLTAALFLKK